MASLLTARSILIYAFFFINTPTQKIMIAGKIKYTAFANIQSSKGAEFNELEYLP